MMSPLSTGAVRYLASGFPRLPTRKKTPTAAAATTRIHATVFLLITQYKTPRIRCLFPFPGALGNRVTARLTPRLHGQGRARDARKDRVELFEAAPEQKAAGPAIALGSDQEETGLSRGEVFGPDSRNRETVGDAGHRS